MASKVGWNTANEVVNTVAVSEMSRAIFVRHFERHQSCWHDKRLYFSDVREKVVPGGGLEPPTRGFSVRCSRTILFRQYRRLRF